MCLIFYKTGGNSNSDLYSALILTLDGEPTSHCHDILIELREGVRGERGTKYAEGGGGKVVLCLPS